MERTIEFFSRFDTSRAIIGRRFQGGRSSELIGIGKIKIGRFQPKRREDPRGIYAHWQRMEIKGREILFNRLKKIDSRACFKAQDGKRLFVF